MAPCVVVLLLMALALLAPRRERRQHAAVEAEPAPVPVPVPKTPRDTSRPYPRPQGGRRKPDRTCPVCGTGRETGDLDGRVLGWRAHRTCAEWLGDWKPPDPEIAKLRQALDDAKSHKVLVLPPGKPAVSITVENSPGAQVNVGGGAGGTYTATAMTSVNEARERLNQEIIASWGVPPAILGQHTHKAGDPLPIERCPECGAQFCGTPEYLRSAYKLHLQRGCR